MIKKYLLDTHILIWWLTDDERLSKKARCILANPDNYILVSVVSAWEMSIKFKKLKMSISLRDCFVKTGFEILPIKLEHALLVKELPMIHKDPFDRMLVAQAISEECMLVSVDERVGKYSEISVVC